MPAQKLSSSYRFFLIYLCGWFIFTFSPTARAELSVDNIVLNPTVALTQTSIPIDGFVPQIVFGITDATGNSQEYDTLRQPTMVGTPLPSANPYYTVGIFDTGANINLLSLSDRTGFGVTDIGYECTLSGAGPNLVTADILSSAGYFANGLQALSSSGATPNTAGFKGVSNVRSAAAQQGGAELPTILGVPFAVHYTTVIRTNETYTGTYNGTTYTSPKLDFYTSRYDAGVPTFDHRLKVTYSTPENLPATYVSEDYELLGISPTPTVATTMLIESNLNHNNRFSNGSFLFDTGAQVTVISLDKVIDLGLNINQPQFTVEVAGIGGTNEEVPGFYVETLTLPAIGGVGDLVLHNVPVIAMNVAAAKGGFLDGIIGMNLFTDRNLVIDAGYQGGQWGNAFIGVSGIIGVPGDANHDNLIDVGDLGILAANYGKAGGYASWEMGDFNHDGLIDVGDLGILAANYGYGSLTGINPLDLSTVSIPEPAALVFLGLGGIGQILRRRQKI